ncbi:MAG: DUF4372 domain-containing protein [Rhodoferax sp.]
MAFCANARRAGMHQGKLVFSQLMAYLPLSTFRRCVAKHRGDHKVKDFSCLDQFFAMAFCAADLPGVLARHRSQSACASQSAVPHGLSLSDHFAQHAGQRERHGHGRFTRTSRSI